MRYAANCSMLFTEEPLLRRPAAAHAAGFDAIEFWWPWPVPVPADRDIDAFVTAIGDSGVNLVGLNLFAGDLAGPDCGVLSIPKCAAAFHDNVAVVADIAARLGVRVCNALYGNRIEGLDPALQDEVATAELRHATSVLATVGATVLIEPVSGPKPYPLRTAADAVAVVDRVGAPNIAFLCDLYHLAGNGDDGRAAIRAYADRIGHVQIADAPGRGEPGSGSLDLAGDLAALKAAGYHGYVGLEYRPTTTTIDSLGWLPREERSAR